MPPRATKGLHPKAREAMVKRLRVAGENVAKRESELFRAKLNRDREVMKATELGISRREVAEAVGLTAGGIQQIVSRD